MCRRSSVVLRAALAVGTSLLAMACRKGAPDDSRDAASRETDASLDGASATSPDGAATEVPVATAASPPSTAELSAFQPPPNPFTGTYRCFGGMKLEQAGRIVTSTIHKGTTDTVIVCMAGVDSCTGSVREIQMVRGKPPKVMHVKPVTLTRLASGDIVYVVGAERKETSKGEQTLCPRR